MKTFKEFLTEARSAPLYHSTSFGKAFVIARENILRGTTEQWFTPNKNEEPKKLSGVSLTRSLSFAKEWSNDFSVKKPITIIFQLDQEKLTHNYKFLPIDFFQSTNSKRQDTFGRRNEKYKTAESEEFLIGSIKNLSKYVTKILLPKEAKYEISSSTGNISLSMTIEIFKDKWKVPVEYYE